MACLLAGLLLLAPVLEGGAREEGERRQADLDLATARRAMGHWKVKWMTKCTRGALLIRDNYLAKILA